MTYLGYLVKFDNVMFIKIMQLDEHSYEHNGYHNEDNLQLDKYVRHTHSLDFRYE